ncbi:arginine--tRNA ligase [Candidatus Phytoplasma sacchari]|uniref:Arginine--tRNA ligase n=1 Tax=Candidatus Phytoplasma sacchari TaxID=2609813 RepID=A0ABY7M374_9MOLU|nr:arginine--tRNA ligase [Candidatus Phytoplasma sacchari]KAB8122301.1 arginine--tRNA ligase [Candidatus Phytoplasma sacchari]WBL31552.1 arginine--tRNA ligase [Candidatus Phytoplasma sacchari]
MYIKKIQKKIEKTLNKKYNIKFQIKNNNKNNVDMDFDFYLPLFSYSQKINQNIESFFYELKTELILLKEIKDIFFEKGFLNIKINKKIVIKKIIFNILKLDKKKFKIKKINHNKKVIFDYSSPNIAKNFSIGHLRSTIIGNSLKNIYEKLGFQTISINHLGDWGIQFAKMILAYRKWGNKEIISKKPINELQKLYILFHQKEKQNKELKEEAREIFKKLENKNKEEVELWKWFKKISLKEFKKIYKLLNISFDYYTGESFFHKKTIKLVNEFKRKKIVKLDQGAYIIPLKNIIPALIQKKNGSYLYLTRDITCALFRYKKFNFSKMIYVVGNEQKLHFQQLFQIIKKIGYNFRLENVNFGLILVNNEKISTRKNINYDLRKIIQKASEKAQEIIKIKNPKLKNINKIAEKIAIGAIIFNDLKNDRHLDIEFDLNQMLTFDGNTGPYLQYTIVRFNSIIEKNHLNKNNKFYWSDKINKYYEKKNYFDIIKLIDQFYFILEISKKENMPSILARYLLKLAKNANQFYAKEKILVNDQILNKANFLFIKVIVYILKEGLNLLGIPILNKM